MGWTSQVFEDFRTIHHTFQVKYAPFQWKKQYFGWELNDAFYRLYTAQYSSHKELQMEVARYFSSFGDLHVGVLFYSTESAMFPFQLVEVEGRYFIAWVCEKWASEVFPELKEGVEITHFNDISLGTLVDQYIEEDYQGHNTPTTRFLALKRLTFNMGAKGHKVSQDPVLVQLASGEKRTVEWIFFPEQITPPADRLWQKNKKDFLFSGIKSSFINRLRCYPYYLLEKQTKQSLLGSQYEEKETIGAKNSSLPILGPICYDFGKKSTFQAYIFSHQKKKKIGFVRIPSYNFGEEEVEEFRKIIKIMERSTDGLIIDQRNNPGGHVFFMYALLSMLTDHPLQIGGDAQKITQEDVYEAATFLEALSGLTTDQEVKEVLGDTICGYPVDLRLAGQIEAYCIFVVNAWQEQKELTFPYPILGIDQIMPHKTTRYTKPILMLVNERSISCGDFAPACLQDNGRAVIGGSRTAGAGGCVKGYTFPNYIGVCQYTCTHTLAHRMNGEMLENLGVTPDIDIPLQVEDLTHGFHSYSQTVLSIMEKLLK